LGEGAQHGGRFVLATDGQRQAGQGDHRVAAPVAEPGIPGQNARAGDTPDVARDDELVGGERKLANPRGRLVQIGLEQQGALPLALGLESRLPVERRLLFDREGERQRVVQGQLGVDGPCREQVLLVIHAAFFLLRQVERPPPF